MSKRLTIALFYVLHLRSKACRWEFGYLRKSHRVSVFYFDEDGQAKIVQWKGLIAEPSLCLQIFRNIEIGKEDLKKLYDDPQDPYHYGDEEDKFLAKSWYQNKLAEGNERILAMAKVDAAAKFVYLKEHQAWCELPLRVLCHGLASDFPPGDLQTTPEKVEATNKLMKAYVETGHHEEAAQLGKRMLDLNILDDWNKAKLKTNLGWVYKEWKDPQEAKNHLQQSLDIVNDKCYDVKDDRDLQKARILNNFGPVCTDLGRHKEALEKLEESWKLLKTHLGSKDGLGAMKNLLEDLEKRDRVKQEPLTEVQEMTGLDLLTKYPEVATCLNNLGNAYGKLGMYERHSKQLEICMILEVRYYGKEHPKVAAVLTNLSLVRLKELQFRAAKTYLKRSLRLHKMHFGKVNEHLAEVLCNLAVVCAKLKEREEREDEKADEKADEVTDEEADEEADPDADGYLKRCESFLEELGAGHDVLSAKIKNNRAILHMWRGELQEAEEGFRKSLTILEEFLKSLNLPADKSQQPPELLIEFTEIWHNLGEVLLEMVEKEDCTDEERKKYCEEACTHLNASIESFEQFKLNLKKLELELSCASQKVEQVSSRKLLTKAYMTLGKFDEAKKQLQEVRKILKCEPEESEEQVHLVEVLHYEAVIEYKIYDSDKMHKLENLHEAKDKFEDCLKEGEKYKKKIKKKFMVQINSNLALTCRFLQAQETDDSRKKSLEEREEQALQFCVDSLKSLHEQGVEPAEPTDESVKEKALESEDVQFLTRLGLVQVDRKKYTEAEHHLDRALQSKLSCLEIQRQDCEELVQIVDALGFVYAQLQKKSKEAQLQNISKEKKMLEHLIGFKADGEKISIILKRLCAACMKIENIEFRIKFAKELLATCKTSDFGDVEHAHVLVCLAMTFLEKHDLNEVKNGCCSDIPNLCLKLDKDANMELLQSLSETWFWLGEDYVSQEMYEDACSVLKECLDIKQRIYTDVRHVEVAKVHLELGPVYRIQRDATMAKKTLEDVLIPDPPSGAKELDLATAWGDLGLVYGDLGDFEEAKKYLTRCWKKKNPEDLEVVVHNLRAIHQRFNRPFDPEEWSSEEWSKKHLAP